MNTKRTMIAGLVTLVAVLANVVSVFAYPAEMPEITPGLIDPADSCQAYQDALAKVDIPQHRSDYAVLDSATQCAAGRSKLAAPALPVRAEQQNRYANFKDHQADLASGPTEKTSKAARSPFNEFKEQQADQIGN